MTSLKESELRKKYNIDFNKIKEVLENATVSPEFWAKQAEKNAEAMRKAKEEIISYDSKLGTYSKSFWKIKG